MRTAVVIPTYNESDNIAHLLEGILKMPLDLDIVVVDDNSPDGTANLVTTYCEHTSRVHVILRTGSRGFGPSCIDGIRYVISNDYEAVITMDADLSHDPADLTGLLLALESHDCVIGSRYYQGRISVVNWPLSRLMLSLFAGRYVRLITRLRVSDPTSGFRGFKVDVLKAIDLDSIHSNGYSFLVETIYRVRRLGFDVAEIPIVFTERRNGASKMTLKIILEAVLVPWLLKFRRRW